MADRFTGADNVLARLKKIQLAAPDKFGRALYQEAEIEAKECKRRCPVDTDALRASIHVEGPQREGRRIWVTIVAGGAAVDYALYVHENLEALHTNGEAKFIEYPLKESAPYMAGRVAARIDFNDAVT